MRSERRRDLLRILHEGRASSQSGIVAELQAAGHDVTQTTVSRDLKELGATKVRMGDAAVYRLPDEIPHSSTGDLMARSLIRTLGEFALSITPAASLLVVRTAPGHAAAVARAIDLAGLDEVVGTVAGDDTIFVAATGAENAERLARHFRLGTELHERRVEEVM